MSGYLLRNYFKGAKVFFSEFLEWSSGLDVVRFNEHLITYGEVWSQSRVFVSRGGVLCLCGRDGITELEVKFIEVYVKVLGSV